MDLRGLEPRFRPCHRRVLTITPQALKLNFIKIKKI